MRDRFSICVRYEEASNMVVYNYKKKYPVLAYVRRNTCSELTYEGQKYLTSIRTGV